MQQSPDSTKMVLSIKTGITKNITKAKAKAKVKKNNFI
jgi:hypothetical protein